MRRKYNFPHGYKTWRITSSTLLGGFRVIASNEEKVIICDFDGVSEQPIFISNYATLS